MRMKKMMKTYNPLSKQLWFGFALAMSLVACSDDQVDTNNVMNNGTTGGTNECAADEMFNPILGRCVKLPTGNPMDMNGPGGMDMPGNVEMDMPAPVDMGEETPDMEVADMGDPSDQGGDQGGDPDQGNDPDMMTPDQGVMPDMGGDTCGYGTILGVACVPSGDALPNAQVTVTGIDCHTGQPFTKMTTASATGRYELTDIPSGAVEVTLESGSFNRTFPVTLDNGEMLDLTQAASKVCIEGNSVNIAVISGEYDDVQSILSELQFSFDIKGSDGQVGSLFGFPSVNDPMGLQSTRDFLMDPTEMALYDVIFINCGTLWNGLQAEHSGDIATIINNLFNYYQSGKSIYASDLAYIFIERPFPAVIDFLPVGGNDSDYGGPLQGYAPYDINADVVSPALQNILGTNTVLIDFPQNATTQSIYWAMMGGTDPNAEVLLRGTAPTCMGTGCSSQGPVQSDIPLLVTYKSPSHGGSLAFTSFHNHPAGTPISPEISAILKYLILQL